MMQPRLRRTAFDFVKIRNIVHTGELLAPRERCFDMQQVTAEARRDELVFDRLQPRRRLRMPGSHVVQQAIRVSDESRRHDGMSSTLEFSSYLPRASMSNPLKTARPPATYPVVECLRCTRQGASRPVT